MNRLYVELLIINQLERLGTSRRNIKSESKLMEEFGFSEDDFYVVSWKLGLMNKAHHNLPDCLEKMTVEQLCDYFQEIAKPKTDEKQTESPSLFLYS